MYSMLSFEWAVIMHSRCWNVCCYSWLEQVFTDKFMLYFPCSKYSRNSYLYVWNKAQTIQPGIWIWPQHHFQTYLLLCSFSLHRDHSHATGIAFLLLFSKIPFSAWGTLSLLSTLDQHHYPFGDLTIQFLRPRFSHLTFQSPVGFNLPSSVFSYFIFIIEFDARPHTSVMTHACLPRFWSLNYPWFLS